ncbi:uncharacterized protein Z519_02019 [Cladophialophora bantiana CBS 173.52]|uniref:Uncharacterized protein n=1 Tax=Cladophialophora bantiana (strain ATCC 10958 / CBS 173.52 / CDC B-1940 / NIH 8579) TaxID=1442370 RepID=A0A0D2HT24_CLAB1|nr:uncharacterized protein Z519_02019 [Cladophialophora bantiana CBS 173.52]KIW96628.1 hypothetical protein Z519_02019 [Cladophialophora bantiana CBS 173.52]
MWFARRRSSLAAEPIQNQPEPRRRNRLSKPLTSNATKISTVISAPGLHVQVPVSRSKNASGTDLSSPLSPMSGDAASRQQFRDDTPPSEANSPLHARKNDSNFRVAYMVSQLEGKVVGTETSPTHKRQQQATPPLSPIKQPKRKSLLLRRLSLQRSSSITRTPSNERFNSLKSDTTVTTTTDASMDKIIDPQPIPPTRRSSFTPGTATRKPSEIAKKQEIQERKAIQEMEEQEAIAVDMDSWDWQPPPPRTVGRAGTPSDISYSHLGGLRLGSLQIVNGRASPTFSEVSKASKQLRSAAAAAAAAPRRDGSSDYGDAEEDSELLISAAGNPSNWRSRPSDGNAELRYFSWEPNDDKAGPQIHPLQSVMTAHQDADPTPAEDQTSLMAKEYIAELGASPFDQQMSSSPVGTVRRSRSDGSLWRVSSCSSLQNSSRPGSDLGDLSPVSPLERSSSPTGSVLRKASVRTEESGCREIPQNDDTNDEHRPCDSPMSWYSPIEPSYSVDEGFQSAVEFQAQLSNPSVGLQPLRAPEKSDSGYSSSNSLRSLQMARPTPSPAKFEALPEVPDAKVSTDASESGRAPNNLGLRPSILKSRKTDSYVPTFTNLRPSTVSSTPKQIVPATTAAEADPASTKLTNFRKKLLKKRRPLSQPPGQIAVVRVQSFELDSIPLVSPEARENLRVRSHAVPELEQTYSSLDTLASRASRSTLFLPINEVRLPSPAPQQALQVKRPRSRSRPRSWFGRPKEEKVSSKGKSGISQAEAFAIINDPGTVSTSLGKSAYGSPDASNVSEGINNPLMISGFLQPRSMIIDEAAADLSPFRRRSIQERESNMSDRRSSFNDRGGIPGKNLRPASLASDAPPITPEMIEKAYRTSSMQRQPSIHNEVGPRPPPHSPRPSYIDYEGDSSDPIAPPPPSHSPRPIDITPHPWATQAAVWKARRQSAGELLKLQSWDSRKHEQYYEDVADESLYPIIPPRQVPQEGEWTQAFSPEGYSSFPHDYPGGYNRSSLPQLQEFSSYGASYYGPCESESAYVRESRRSSRAPDHRQPRGRGLQSREPSPHDPFRSARASAGTSSSRPQSNANSVRSFGPSLAEELHPTKSERQYPPPAFGRYSGGLKYGYEGGNGLGGSVGTRSMSGKAEASRKGVSLRASFGVDQGNVPLGIMSRW